MDFEDKTFCFTGTMLQLKRTNAEREVRKRKGLSQKIVNKELDYLVVGSKASPKWKYGDYGNKINKAVQLCDQGAEIKIISEDKFLNGLESVPDPEDSGSIDKKILICRYSSFVSGDELDRGGVDKLFSLFNEAGFNITASLEDPYIYSDLYNEYTTDEIENLLLFKCRLVRYLSIDYDCQKLIDSIAIGFESINGLDGDLTSSEKIEGSASFAKLFLEMKSTVKLADPV